MKFEIKSSLKILPLKAIFFYGVEVASMINSNNSRAFQATFFLTTLNQVLFTQQKRHNF
jgi:hypothetical protein